MERLIIVEVGVFDDGTGAKSYQLYEKLSNGTFRLAKKLPDDGENEPMYFRDARSRMALMYTVKAYGGADDIEEEL